MCTERLILTLHGSLRLVIGLFGLVGMVGVALMPVVGRTIDRLVPWSATLFGISMLLVTFSIQTAAAGLNVAVVVIVTIGLDLFRQMQQVSLTTAVLGLDANARSRLNAVINLAVRYQLKCTLNISCTHANVRVPTDVHWPAYRYGRRLKGIHRARLACRRITQPRIYGLHPDHSVPPWPALPAV